MNPVLFFVAIVLCYSHAVRMPVRPVFPRTKRLRLLHHALCIAPAPTHAREGIESVDDIDPSRTEHRIAGDTSRPTDTTVSKDNNEYRAVIDNLLATHCGRLVCINSPRYPHCEIYLCGTLHVANSSVELVRSAVRCIVPHYVVLELCEERMDVLIEPQHTNVFNHTLAEIFRSAVKSRSRRMLGMDLLSWMQTKSAKLLNAKLGGELSAAAAEAHKLGTSVILGDRKYSITMQRIFDKLSTFEKIKIGIMFVLEALTMSLIKMQEYITHSEQGTQFLQDEVAQFAKYMPALADVVIFERDEYLAQSISELARTGFGPQTNYTTDGTGSVECKMKGRILAVVGAGHLEGIMRHLMGNGTSSEERMQEISRSSKEDATWPGAGMLHVVDLKSLYNHHASS